MPDTSKIINKHCENCGAYLIWRPNGEAYCKCGVTYKLSSESFMRKDK